jgi:predicted NACHT family NTPase
LWETYGKDLLEKADKAMLDKAGRESKKLWDEQQWKESAQRYLKNLHDDVSKLRVLGKSEDQSIEEMYTDVNVLGKLNAEKRYSQSQLEADYEYRVGLRGQEKERLNGLVLARNTQRLFILGKPGAGKTTFLKHVALQTIQGVWARKSPFLWGCGSWPNRNIHSCLSSWSSFAFVAFQRRNCLCGRC